MSSMTSARRSAPAGDSYVTGTVHYPDHRGTVETGRPGSTPGGATFDAIVVPTARTVEHLAEAIGLAVRQRAVLFVLCSGEVTAAQVRDYLDRYYEARGENPDCLAIDLTAANAAHWMLELRTSGLAGRVGGLASDVATKRNVALLVARVAGWKHILFLDDDVRALTTPEVASARNALEGYDAAGWAFTGEHDRSSRRAADNSVVCHAHRLAGGSGREQRTFIGAGALAVKMEEVAVPYFPVVYNEDWLFLFDLVATSSVALLGEMQQAPYNPFRSPARARSQEVGDVLAEGLYRGFHRTPGRGVDDATVRAAATTEYWRAVVAHRRTFIADIRARLLAGCVDNGSPDHLARLAALRSLEAAEAQLTDDLPRVLARWVSDWRHDLQVWRTRLRDLRQAPNWRRAAREVGLEGALVMGRRRRELPTTPLSLKTLGAATVPSQSLAQV